MSAPQSVVPEAIVVDSVFPRSTAAEAAPAGPVGVEEENRWVAAAQAGDRQAFGWLYAAHVPVVYRYVRHRVSSREAARDLTQEVFVRALRCLGSYTYRPGKGFGAWLSAIARNLIVDAYKSGRNRFEVACGDAAEFIGAAVQDRWTDPEHYAVFRDVQSRLREVLLGLTDEQAECLWLRFWQGLSVERVAAAMGKNSGAIKALQYRACRRLKALLGPDGASLDPTGPDLVGTATGVDPPDDAGSLPSASDPRARRQGSGSRFVSATPVASASVRVRDGSASGRRRSMPCGPAAACRPARPPICGGVLP